MSTVYIVSDSGRLVRANKTLVYEMPDGTRTIIHPHRTSQIVVQGNADLSSSAIKLLMQHGIQTVFLNKNGRFNGKIDFGPPKNVAVRLKQQERLHDNEFGLAWAKTVARAKIRNQINFAQRISRKEEERSQDLQNAIRDMSDSEKKLEECTEMNQVRGLEGWSARRYFSVFRFNVIPDWAEFNGRSMNPPKDNVNAVLSFLYTLLRYRVEGAVLQEQLDPYVGFLHSTGFGKESLVYDLMEQFRTPVADTVTASLFNLGILNKDDFRQDIVDRLVEDNGTIIEDPDSTTEAGAFETVEAVLLTKDGIRKAVEQFERKLSSEVYVPVFNRRMSYRRIIPACVHSARRFICGDESEMTSLVLR
jgi:CRISP-associated protein Cas1